MLVTKLRKKILDAESKPKHSFVLKETFVSKKGDSSPTSARTSEFMSKIRFLEHLNIPACCQSRKHHLLLIFVLIYSLVVHHYQNLSLVLQLLLLRTFTCTSDSFQQSKVICGMY